MNRLSLTFGMATVVAIVTIAAFLAVDADEESPPALLKVLGSSTGSMPRAVPPEAIEAPLVESPADLAIRPAPPAPGRVKGVVAEALELRGLGGVQVGLMNSNGVRHVVSSDPSGHYVFDDLEPGDYSLTVSPDSLPGSVLPPPRSVPAAESPGVAYDRIGKSVKVSAPGQTQRVDLILPVAARASGIVSGPRGQGIEGLSVTLQRTDRSATDLGDTTVTDEHGGWDSQPLYPGPYRIQVLTPRGHGFSDQGRPIPQPLELLPGAKIWIDLRLGAGPYELSGKVLDQYGEPFEDIEVLIFFWKDPSNVSHSEGSFGWNDVAARTCTDTLGRYVLHGLPKATVRIQFEPGFRPNAPLGQERIAEWGEQLEIRLSRHTPGAVQAPPVVLKRSEPYIVTGRIVSASSEILPARSLRVRISFPDPKQKEARVSLADDGSFQWGCETPHSPIQLYIVRRRDRVELRRFDLYPRPSTNEDVTLTIP